MSRILVVEDDDDVRATIAEILDVEEHEVLEARNGREALELLRRTDRLPDVILLDLMMPVMDGVAFRAEQRRDPRLRDVPVVLVSASTELPSVAAELEVADVLRKPFPLKTLVELAKRFGPREPEDE